jgi:radical SAM superfamily enzyme YgiQ (UPF0313 family)
MKIAFIAPHLKFISEYKPIDDLVSEEINNGLLKLPEFNLPLLTLAALTPKSFEISIFDEEYKPIDFEGDFDIVAISSPTFTIFRAYEIAKKFRERGVYTVIGGNHPTLLPAEAAPHVDTVFVGEVEETWPQFLKDFQKREAKKIYYGTQPDLSLSPIPRWDLMSEFFTPEAIKMFRTTHRWEIKLNATRGCPRDCEFCSSTRIYGPKYRKKSIPQVTQEIRAAKKWSKHFGIDQCFFMFCDDNLLLDVQYGSKLLDALKEEKISWGAFTDIGIHKHPELIQKLYSSGCRVLNLGFESVSQASLQSIAPWKSKQVMHYEEFMEMALGEGFLINLGFILGTDNDTEETIQLIDDFLTRYPILPNFLFLTPFPNQALTNRLKKEGRLPKKLYWDRCNAYNILFEPKQMSKEELHRQFIYLYKKYRSPEHRQTINDELLSRKQWSVDQVHLRFDLGTKMKLYTPFLKELELSQLK